MSAFEDWCRTTQTDHDPEYPLFKYSPHRNDRGEYIFYRTRDAYEGWRAANARTAKILDDLQLKLLGKPDAERMCKVLELIKGML